MPKRKKQQSQLPPQDDCVCPNCNSTLVMNGMCEVCGAFVIPDEDELEENSNNDLDDEEE